MSNLLLKTKKGTKTLASTPFKSEDEFEKIIFETPEILEDIFLIRRQIRGGGKTGIPDIIGIDNDGNICIIEMKNVDVDSTIIPQVLEYAFWAEKNPDSIKSLWLESKSRPEDLTVSWEKNEVRIIIIAPKIYSSALDLVNKINYSVDLIEINRWIEGENQLLLVEKLEPEKGINKISPVRGLGNYDEAFYKTERNPVSVKEFMKYTQNLNKFVKANKWALEMKYNKHYCGYKSGFFNAFGIKWVGSKSFALFIKLTEQEAKKYKVIMTKYESHWKEAVYYIEPGKTNLEDFVTILEYAYKKLTGL
jgi:hypothetical protein